MRVVSLTRTEDGSLVGRLLVDSEMVEVVFTVDRESGIELVTADPNIFNGYPIELDHLREILNAVAVFDRVSA